MTCEEQYARAMLGDLAMKSCPAPTDDATSGTSVATLDPGPRAPQGRRRLRVLLAEDDAEMRQLLVWALRQDGYEVIEARDGAECVGYAQPWVFRGRRVEPPDVIVSDVRMPGWSGLEMLGILRAGEAVIPVILITAFGAPEAYVEAWRLGAAAVLNKPFEMDDLRRTIRDAVRMDKRRPFVRRLWQEA